MPSSIAKPSVAAHLLLSDINAKMAKAGIRKADTDAYYVSLGACMKEVQNAFDLSLEEFAHALGKNDRQIARQMTGVDRPMIEAVFAVERFRAPMVIALARMSAGVEVVTEIRVRRLA